MPRPASTEVPEASCRLLSACCMSVHLCRPAKELFRCQASGVSTGVRFLDCEQGLSVRPASP